jgi:addiction module HigA family antidote
MPPVHPGEILLEEFLKPLAVSQYRLAKALDVPRRCPRYLSRHLHRGGRLAAAIQVTVVGGSSFG